MDANSSAFSDQTVLSMSPPASTVLRSSSSSFKRPESFWEYLKLSSRRAMCWAIISLRTRSCPVRSFSRMILFSFQGTRYLSSMITFLLSSWEGEEERLPSPFSNGDLSILTATCFATLQEVVSSQSLDLKSSTSFVALSCFFFSNSRRFLSVPSSLGETSCLRANSISSISSSALLSTRL